MKRLLPILCTIIFVFSCITNAFANVINENTSAETTFITSLATAIEGNNNDFINFRGRLNSTTAACQINITPTSSNLILHNSPDANNILYVDINVSGGNESGDSWANAIPELADALVYAQNNKSNWTTASPLKIYVAGGVYKPLYSPADGNFGNDDGRNNSFLMVKNVQLYGGFAGTETTLADRDLSLTANATTLSGDIGNDDVVSGSGSTLSITNNDENNYHVVVSSADVGSAKLDGFSLIGGNANDYSSISINSNSFSASLGGGMSNNSSSPTLANVSFSENTADAGGGMYNDSYSSPSLTNVSFSENTAGAGGGMYNIISSSPSLTNVSFSKNTANYGGGMSNASSSPSLTNVSFSENTADSGGGGMYNDASSPSLTNCIIWGNIATTNGNGIYNESGSTPLSSYSLVQDFSDTGNNNLDGTDPNNAPQFTDAANGDLSLQNTSPAVNAGDPSTDLSIFPENTAGNPIDLAGNPRVYDGTPTTDIIDMGAYELQGEPVDPADAFITTWQTTTANESITIPINTNVTGYNYTVDWGDGNTSTAQTGDATHQYVTAGTYTVSITGDFPAIKFGTSPSTNANKLLTIEQWGTQVWSGMQEAFMGCSNLTTESATDAPIFSAGSSLNRMFFNCSNFNSDLNDWDLTNVNNLYAMFDSAASFNGNITNWNVQNVSNMDYMFKGTSVFNQDIGGWDVSNVNSMFAMFDSATAFNQDISNWNVANVTVMMYMLKNTLAFNQNIGGWNVANVANMSNMFDGASLSTTNYDALLVGWNAQTLKPNVSFNGGNSKYCSQAAIDARANMIANDNWAITDGGSAAPTITAMADQNAVGSYILPVIAGNNLSGNEAYYTETGGAGTSYNEGDELVFTDFATYPVTLYTYDENSCSSAEESFELTITNSADAFKTTWQTTTANESITIPINTNVVGYNYTVDWGDGNTSTSQTTDATHEFTIAGTYTVSITGDFPAIKLGNGTENNAQKLLTIEQWGTQIWQGMDAAFKGCSNLTSESATDAPIFSANSTLFEMFANCSSFNSDLDDWDLTNVTETSFMFNGATSFNGAITNWNTANVTNMQYMFYQASAFNSDVSNWNVQNVTRMDNMFSGASVFNGDVSNWNVQNIAYMSGMFWGASAFNGNVSNWNVASVTGMNRMFYNAYSFNGDVSNWNVLNVTDMSYMFSAATAFNGDVSNWNVVNVTDISYMFSLASAFNGNLSNWNVANVTDMSYMFYEALAFNQDIGNWDIGNVTNMSYMFYDVTLSTENYDNTLIGWATDSSGVAGDGVDDIPGNITLGGGGSKFCVSEVERQDLIDSYNWNITDGGRNPGCTFCPETTTYTIADGWDNGVPTSSKKAVFADDYNTTLGSIDACSIEINSGATLTVSEGTTIKAVNDIVIDGDLIFLSSANGDGQLGVMGANSNITGNATVHRYMMSKRSYRMVSPAVTTTTSSIHDNWQEGATIANPNPNLGFGTHITGSQTGQNGFDATATGNPSMFTVNVASQQFQAITNTDVNTLTAGNPYLLFVRGDRTIDLSDNDAAGETVLRSTGALITGTNTQNFATEDAGDFAMFGNPYQSAVDINSVFANSTNVNTNIYYVYDPSLGDHGAYVTVNLPAGTNTSNSNANQYLQPGQGAQLATIVAGSSEVAFNESDKSPEEFTATSRPMAGNNMLVVQLFTTENFNNGGPVHDSFGIVFAEGNDNSLTSADAVKPMNFYENLGVNQNGTYLSIEQREIPQSAEVYSLYSSGYSKSEYTLKLTIDGLESTSLYLDDHFTGTSSLLGAGDNAYSYSVDTNNGMSIATNRFSIRTEQRLGIDDNNLLAGIHLYPNPLNGDTFYINAPRLNGEELKVTINDLSGRRIFDQSMECRANTVTVPMDSNIASGVYMVTLKHDGETLTYRLIKE